MEGVDEGEKLEEDEGGFVRLIDLLATVVGVEDVKDVVGEALAVVVRVLEANRVVDGDPDRDGVKDEQAAMLGQ